MGPPPLTPVRRRDLAVLALGLTLASWLLVRASYGQLPPLDWWLPAPLAFLAGAEAYGARTIRERLAAVRRARTGSPPTPRAPGGARVRPVEPMMVARLAVLAQASAWLGAGSAGVWGGVLAHVGPEVGRLQAAGADAVTAVIGIVCATALVAAGLWLESVCRVPPHDPSSSGGHRGQEPSP
ncbi:MAG: DUF3180 domain-containing protein [Actinomycetes bacterium]